MTEITFEIIATRGDQEERRWTEPFVWPVRADLLIDKLHRAGIDLGDEPRVVGPFATEVGIAGSVIVRGTPKIKFLITE